MIIEVLFVVENIIILYLYFKRRKPKKIDIKDFNKKMEENFDILDSVD